MARARDRASKREQIISGPAELRIGGEAAEIQRTIRLNAPVAVDGAVERTGPVEDDRRVQPAHDDRRIPQRLSAAPARAFLDEGRTQGRTAAARTGTRG